MSITITIKINQKVKFKVAQLAVATGNRAVGQWEQILTIIQALTLHRLEVRINMAAVRTREQFPRLKMITNNTPELKINSRIRVTCELTVSSNRGELLSLLTPKAKGKLPKARCAPDAWAFWETVNANDVTNSTAKATNRGATTETASPKKSPAFKSNSTSKSQLKRTKWDKWQTQAKSKHKVDKSNSTNQDSNLKRQRLRTTNMKDRVTITNA